MKLVCNHCENAQEAAAARIEGEQLILTCRACGAESALPVASREVGESGPRAEPAREADDRESVEAVASETPEPGEAPTPAAETPPPRPSRTADGPAALPPIKCPRCFHRQTTNRPCHRCGLDLAASEATPADWDEIPPGADEARARAIEMWARIEAAPEREDLHQRFLDHCTEHGLLTFGVRRYREHLADHPHDERMATYRERAARKLQTVALTLLGSDTWADGVARQTRLARRILLIIAALLVLAGLILMAVVFSRTGSLTPTAF